MLIPDGGNTLIVGAPPIPGSSAANAGVVAGDKILEVNEVRTGELKSNVYAVRTKAGARRVALDLRRTNALRKERVRRTRGSLAILVALSD